MAGEHLEMVSNFSDDARNLLDALLQVEEAKRPTIQEILHFPVVINEVNKIISSSEFNEQFNILIARKLNFAWSEIPIKKK